MQYAESLIDKAIESCGSAAELARKMGIDRAEVTKLKQGKRPLSPELAAELADIAGDDAREAAIHAIIERNAEGRKGHLLREILGKALAAGVVGMWVFSYNGDSIYATEKIATKLDSLYIVSSQAATETGPV
jgi:transcriptional regulator with XRE-family HTH domain